MISFRKLVKSTKLYSFGICAAIFIAASSASLSASASAPLPTLVSPALSVIAENSGMAMAGIIGNSISFEAEDFARALNLSKVGAIVITQAPPQSEGELRVGNTVITGGQVISASSLELLTYTASSDSAKSTSFRFRSADSAYDIPCELYLLEKVNASPTLESVPKNFLNVSTHRNISSYGTLECHDPEGDATVFEIVSYPKNGTLKLADKSTGEYVYTPRANFSGRDSFTYVARDKYGNYSASAKVSLEVRKPSTTVVFDDMASSPYYNAALTMVEEGIMSGTQLGSDTYFYPEREVSRGEFVVMTMHALGMRNIQEVSSTPFADDASIPSQMKGYISAAYSLGYINGSNSEDGLCFYADRAITRAEAAVILGNILDVATPTVLPTFADSADVPAWAAPSIYSLNSIGVMRAVDGNISAKSVVTRADAAQILCDLIAYRD